MGDKTSIFLICLVIVVLIFAGVQVYVNNKAPKTSFAIGQCYEIANQDNPFREKPDWAQE
jgi:hypothetical protein